MKKCTKCGQEAYVVNNEGLCYNCMDDVDKKLTLIQYQKLKAQIEGNSENEEDKTPTKEEFEKQAEFENRMRTFVKELRKQKEEDAFQQAEEQNLNVNVGGAGSVSLRPEDIQREKGESGNLEFDSHEEMIDFLRRESVRGNTERKEQLNELWKKVVKAMREQPTKANFQISDKDWLKKLKERQTLEWKKKQGVLKENE